MNRLPLTLLLCLMCGKLFAQQKPAVSVYFASASSKLSPKAKITLDSLVYNDVLIKGKKLSIIGYADYVGSEQSNDSLSKQRAGSIETYLIYMGIRKEDITVVTGKGEVSRTETANSGLATDRRVDIIPGGYEAPKPIDITKVEKGGTVRLENILFQGGSAIFLQESMPTLQMLLKTMNDNPRLKIQIEGHVCCPYTKPTGMTEERSARDEQVWNDEGWSVSRDRARAVYRYLVAHGVDSTRMQSKGFGRTKMLVKPEQSEDDMKKNRRVEIRIVDK